MHQLKPATANALIDSVQSGKMLPHDAMRAAEVFAITGDIGKSTIINLLMYSAIGLACSAAIASPAGFLVGAGGFVASLFQKAAKARSQSREIVRMSDHDLVELLADNDREILTSLINACAQLKDSLEPTPTAAELCTNPETLKPQPRSVLTVAQPTGITVYQGDVALSLGEALKPTIISARPRVGKGIIVSHASQHAKRIHGVTIWVLQPKPHQSELGYWKHADCFLGINLEDYPRDDETVAQQLTKFFMDWRSQAHRPTLLIVDELVKIEAMQPKWYKSQLTAHLKVEASSGETDGRYLWAITQSPLVSDLGLSGGNRAAFDFMAIEKADTQDHAESVRASIRSIDQLPAPQDYTKSPVGCLIYHTALNGWAAVPEYSVPQLNASDRICPGLRAVATGNTLPCNDYQVITDGPMWGAANIPTVATETAEDDKTIELEEIVETALDLLQVNPGKQFTLTKLVPDRYKRQRWSEQLIESLSSFDGVEYTCQKHGAVTQHKFSYTA